MALRIVTPEGASPREHRATPKQFNEEQCRAVLQQIAGRLDTLNRLLMLAQQSEEPEAGIMVNAAQLIAISVGALADSASGSDILGGPDIWNYGPSFADLGKEVSHG